MLVRLLYVSRAVGPQTTYVTSSILDVARKRNPVQGITGVLFQGQGLYMQMIEGERSAVNKLFAQIMKDPRHADVEILSFSEIAKRTMEKWSMAHVNLSDMDPMVLMKHPEFDPYSATAQGANQMLEDFASSGVQISTVVQ